MKQRHFSLAVLTGFSAFGIFFSGCALLPSEESKSAVRETVRPLEVPAAMLGATVRNSHDGSCLISRPPRSELTLLNGKTMAYYNGRKLYLNFPPRELPNGEYHVSLIDFRSVLLPLLEIPVLPMPRITTVMLDPGHGGHDSGAIGKQSREKDLNLSLALALRDELLTRGYGVFLTRTGDRFVTLDRRGELTREKKPDLFLSLHHNADAKRNPASHGIEIFVLTPPGGESTAGNGGTPSHRRIGNRCDGVNLILATRVQSYLIARTGAEDRGVKHARFKVLTLADCPAMLIEAGFVSNPEEETRLNRPDYRQKIVKAIADALDR